MKQFILLLISLFIWSHPCFATYAFISSASAVSTNSNTIAATLNDSGADLDIVLCSHFNAVACTVSDSNMNSWTHWTAADQDSGVTLVEIWYSRVTSVGSSHTFTATCTACYPMIAVATFSGSTSSPTDQFNGAHSNPNSSLATGSVTPSTNNQLLISTAGSNGTSNTFGFTGGWTIVEQKSAVAAQGVGGALAYLIETTATTANPTWTMSAFSDIAVNIGTFKPNSGTPATCPPLSLLGVGCENN